MNRSPHEWAPVERETTEPLQAKSTRIRQTVRIGITLHATGIQMISGRHSNSHCFSCVLIVFIAVAIAGCGRDAPESQKSAAPPAAPANAAAPPKAQAAPKSPSAVVALTAGSLATQFDKNPDATIDKFSGKTVEVHGIVKG